MRRQDGPLRCMANCGGILQQGGNFVIDQRLIPICVAGSVLTPVFTLSCEIDNLQQRSNFNFTLAHPY